ncbi:branched-chain amino acid ABC transporter substrate-binding protein [Alkalibacterium sp. s-m-22]
MKKIKDERLKLQYLKIIRIVCIIQTLGIIGILGYEIAAVGYSEARQNPLWLLMIITGTVYAYLQTGISVDQETKRINSRKSLLISISITTLISIVLGLANALSEGGTAGMGLVLGLIVFTCGLIPSYYIYHLRKEQEEDGGLD